jgi:hypothetical protein
MPNYGEYRCDTLQLSKALRWLIMGQPPLARTTIRGAASHRLFIANVRDSAVIDRFSPMPIGSQIRCATGKHGRNRALARVGKW